MSGEMQVTIYPLASDRTRTAEIHQLRAKVGQRTMTDEELVTYAAWLGLQQELELMRSVAEAFERREEIAR